MSECVIQILAAKPADDQETARKFFDWLENVHTPDVFAFKGITRSLFCRRIKVERPFQPANDDYPEYISIHLFRGKEAMAEFSHSPEIQHASKDALETWRGTTGREQIWLVAYRESKRYQRAAAPAAGRKVIQIVSGAPPSDPKVAERFYHWLEEEHILHVFEEFTDTVRATNYRLFPAKLPFQPAVTEYPECITIFEHNSLEALEFQMASLKGRPPASDEWGKDIGFTKNWLVEYEVLKEWNRE